MDVGATVWDVSGEGEERDREHENTTKLQLENVLDALSGREVFPDEREDLGDVRGAGVDDTVWSSVERVGRLV
jgi:hypothetical protein